MAQIAVALGAQWVTRSVLDSGLAVLSLAAGPVLGAFLTGVLTTRVGSGAMLGGMAAGAAVLTWVVDRRLRLHLVRAHRRRRDEHRGARCSSFAAQREPGWPSDSDAVANDRCREAVEAPCASPPRASKSVVTTAAAGRASAGALTFDPYAPLATPDTIFDLASLTKVIATTTLAMRAVDAGRLALDDLVSQLASRLARRRPRRRDGSRSSDAQLGPDGVPAVLSRSTPAAFEFEHAICTLPLEYAPRTQSIYSDLGFMLLGFILEDARAARQRPCRDGRIRSGRRARRAVLSACDRSSRRIR